MNEVLSRFGLSARRCCRLTGWNRSSLQYRPEGRDDATLHERLRYWVVLKPRWGAPSFTMYLKPKVSSSITNAQSISIARKGLPPAAVARGPLSMPQGPNERWSMDFIHDQLATGRRFLCLSLVDDFTRQCLAIRIDTSIGGASVVTVLQRLALSRQLPRKSPVDNGPEFTGKPSTSGISALALLSIISTQANPCRTPSSRASIAPSAMTA